MIAQHVIGSHLVPAPGTETADIRCVIDNSFPPVLTIESGESVTFECPGLPLPPRATVEHFALIDPTRPHTVVGPVAISDAAAGDTLVVEILSIELAHEYGHTCFAPGVGLLPNDFDEPFIQNFEFTNGAEFTELRRGVRIPLNPFCGILGVAPEAPGEHPTIPPRSTGGNLDIRHLVPGSTLYLPVQLDGALFFCGDGHAAQGDGEVCVTGIETAVRATLRFTVDRSRTIHEPQFVTRAPLSIDSSDRGYFATVATGGDLHECSQRAIRQMIDYLETEQGLTRQEAYVLCSLVVDLKINEIVNAPNWAVSAYLPLSVFASD